jgi:hypothetical protein
MASILFLILAIGTTIYTRIIGIHLTEGELFIRYWGVWLVIVGWLFLSWHYFKEYQKESRKDK